jgi:succinyl-diaminopimelate desuccinylase
LQISNINAGTGAENIIPGELELLFNLRFCTELDETTIKQRVLEIFDRFDFDYEISWRLSQGYFH